jgi:hypothetical protein
MVPLREPYFLWPTTTKFNHFKMAGVSMSSLQRIIINVNHSSANLIAQLRELDQLRDQLRKALVSAKKTPGRRRHGSEQCDLGYLT